MHMWIKETDKKSLLYFNMSYYKSHLIKLLRLVLPLAIIQICLAILLVKKGAFKKLLLQFSFVYIFVFSRKNPRQDWGKGMQLDYKWTRLDNNNKNNKSNM
jgi:hypothetical protein